MHLTFHKHTYWDIMYEDDANYQVFSCKSTFELIQTQVVLLNWYYTIFILV